MITVVDAYAVGFQVALTIGVDVIGRPPRDVAKDLAKIPNIVAVALLSGPYPIEAIVVLEDVQALAAFIAGPMTRIEGIAGLHPSFFLDVMKYETGSGPVFDHQSELAIPASSNLDEIDTAIINCLWRNSSETNESIAGALGLSEATVRKRMTLLRERNVIHITAMRNIAIGKQVIFAIVGIDVDPAKLQAAAAALKPLRQVHLLASVLGRTNLIAQVLVEDSNALTALLNDKIARAPGVRRTTCAQASAVIKFDYRWRFSPHPG
jgi:Lrp/AsnC family transcriptional regulator, regulator for asnA, asnC and gidA